jgi:uncharacterized protein (TIGR02679 family)
MNVSDDARLLRLLGGNDLAALRKRLRRYFERTKSGGDPTVFRMSQISPHEYQTLASLMGQPFRSANSIEVNIGAIDAALLRAGIAPTLRLALERLDGPIVHLASARNEARTRWSAIVEECRHPLLSSYLKTAIGLGLLKRLARQDFDVAMRLRQRADIVLTQLPANALPRAQLAAETLGDAHALDAGQATATLVLAVWRQQDLVADVDFYDAFLNTFGEERARDVWARAGVLVNELARPALFLNLPLRDGEKLGWPLGEPTFASLRMLLRSPPLLAVEGRNVYVCENPNLIAIAADQLGTRCAPLVCTEGMPAAAQRTLLTHLAKAGACLLYHGDFDWPGLRIADHVVRAYGARPWRFGSVDYANATARSSSREHLLSGAPMTATWDVTLTPAMQAEGLAIPEEAVALELLEDLHQ